MLFNNLTKIVNDAIETHKSQRIKYTKDKYIKFTKHLCLFVSDEFHLNAYLCWIAMAY